MSDEKTITVKAASIESRQPLWAAVNAAASIGEDLEITIRHIQKPKRRQWIFTETGEVRVPAEDKHEFVVLDGIPCYTKFLRPMGKAPILCLQLREVDA